MPFLIIPLVLLSASVIEDPLYTDCSGDNYTVNSPFETNLKQMLDTLPSLTSPTGFNSTSAGVLQDKVYAKALCRGDVSSVGCQSCVESASREILKQCRTKTAIIWYQLCQVHYSFQNLVTNNGPYSGRYPKWNDQEREMSDPPRYKKAVADLLRELSVEAVFKPSKHMFQTGQVKFSKGETIYGLVQCTRDISGDICFKCLQGASKELIDLGKQGGIMLSDDCNVRFELSRFYNVPGNRWKTRVIVYIVCAAAIVLAILCGVSVICLRRRNRSKAEDEENSQKDLLSELEVPRMVTLKWKDDFASVDELPNVDLATIRAATDNFSDENKLGRGGFGVVYKGVWQDGKEIAVKRLSRKSRQGLEEFKNEVMLIANLQHRNLVRLLGYGVEEEEKLLIYEFMDNKSLDNFVFDPEKRRGLDWRTYCNIIGGIARGLVYLHEDSRLKIIHRDLKPSNILLDHDMVAKISDFGIARIFAEDQNAANTRRAIGTYGYMAPEYAMEGRFSVKSDVFSFGIIVLEIISGKRNSGFSHSEHAQTLLTYAWQLWSEGNELEIADPILLTDTSTMSEVVRCIHIGLLCVQKDPEDRPEMSSVVALLESEQQVVLPHPKQPEFDVRRIVSVDQSSSDASTNHITISSLSPR